MKLELWLHYNGGAETNQTVALLLTTLMAHRVTPPDTLFPAGLFLCVIPNSTFWGGRKVSLRCMHICVYVCAGITLNWYEPAPDSRVLQLAWTGFARANC